MRIVALVLLCLLSQSAQAQGFAVQNLTAVADDAKRALGDGFSARAEPQRLTLVCLDCPGGPMVDLQLGRQTDGTEERVRSGETSIAQLETLCRAKSPDCRLSGLGVAPAVGWISTYPTGKTTGATAIVLRGSDRLIIRAVAETREAATRQVETLVQAVAPRIVGR
ncbi:hypothetical protein BK022_26515 [Methylorubrum extorquens]|uniref:Uncharacterized protein n=1 Tax=Methylorubrum extorquens TaxID=408 RepID=A0A1S1NYF6_METEX|nr:hypothetical protein BK022_26515 [Methylorubrum extorquens]